MRTIDCDFHIHSKYSAATSNRMDLNTIAEQAPFKGLDVVGTGDALHKGWLREIKALPIEEGILKKGDCSFVLTTEVEDARRVHHLIFFPGIASVEALREALVPHTKDMDLDGRPHASLTGEELAELCAECSAMIGPSHAFVPWTSIYKEYDSLSECYGSRIKDVKYLELGLSADTELADTLSELSDTAFLTNSDAHSPWPHRLGREFNRLEVQDVTFEEVKMAIERKKGRKVVLNVGLDPRLGKYHATSCIKCYAHYTLEEAQGCRWRCPKCGARIKKGVKSRIGELGDRKPGSHPPHRPRYLRIAPLAEIIAEALGIHDVYSKKVQDAWKGLVERFKSEIAVLVDVPVHRIEKADARVARLIALYRKGQFTIEEGGGGKYGRMLFDKDSGQKKDTSLMDYL